MRVSALVPLSTEFGNNCHHMTREYNHENIIEQDWSSTCCVNQRQKRTKATKFTKIHQISLETARIDQSLSASSDCAKSL